MNPKTSVDLLDGSIYYLEDSSKKKSNKMLPWSKNEKRSVGPNCVYGKEKKKFIQIQDT